MIHDRLRNRGGKETLYLDSRHNYCGKHGENAVLHDNNHVVKCKFGDIPFDRARVRPFAVANSARHIYVKQEVDNANSYKTRS